MLPDVMQIDDKPKVKIECVLDRSNPSDPTFDSNSAWGILTGVQGGHLPQFKEKPIAYKQLLLGLPESSPLYNLQMLKDGWDGHNASAPSIATLTAAQMLWDVLSKFSRSLLPPPRVEPGADDFVDFTWTEAYPEKQLQIWVYGNSDYSPEWYFDHYLEKQPQMSIHEGLGLRADWYLEKKGEEPKHGVVNSLSELFNVVENYMVA